MITDDHDEIQQLAAEINADNIERRELDKEITEEALAQLETASPNRHSNIVFLSSVCQSLCSVVSRACAKGSGAD